MGKEPRNLRKIDENGEPAVLQSVEDLRRWRQASAGLELEGRAWVRPALVVVSTFALIFLLFFAYHLGVSRGRHLTLIDPVCGRAIDPDNVPCTLVFNNKTIYFDSMDCLKAFSANPEKYGAHITAPVAAEVQKEPPPPAAQDVPLVPDKSVSDPVKDDLAPGGPPEPPGTDAPAATAAAPKEKDAPPADPPLSHPPAAGPEEGPQPTPQSVDGAPSVDEATPTQQPGDDPQMAAPAPDAGPHKSGSHAGAKQKKAPSTLETPPPTSQLESVPDSNGFELPPGISEGPPSRKAPAHKGEKATQSGPADAPSLDEPSAPDAH